MSNKSPDSAATKMCDRGGSLHYVSAHGHDGHEFPHNPWSFTCSARVPGEPACPEARCMTCDGASRVR